MISIELEYKGRTEFGYGDSNVRINIFDNYRDVDNVEKAVNMISKLFFNKKYGEPTVTIHHYVMDYGTVSIGRITRFYSDTTTRCHWVDWNGFNSGDKEELCKFTRKQVKEFYLDCIDYAVSREAEIKAKEEENE